MHPYPQQRDSHERQESRNSPTVCSSRSTSARVALPATYWP